MLNTRMTAVAKKFGDQIISDMAIIGRDLYMKEGASLGVLFATKNRGLLMSSLDGERKQAIGKIPGATLQTVKIADQDVSLLSTLRQLGAIFPGKFRRSRTLNDQQLLGSSVSGSCPRRTFARIIECVSLGPTVDA